jgi:hypothetical protein
MNVLRVRRVSLVNLENGTKQRSWSFVVWTVIWHYCKYHLFSGLKLKKPELQVNLLPTCQHVYFISLSEDNWSSANTFILISLCLYYCMGNCYLTHDFCLCIGEKEVTLLCNWLEIFRLSIPEWKYQGAESISEFPMYFVLNFWKICWLRNLANNVLIILFVCFIILIILFQSILHLQEWLYFRVVKFVFN